MNRSVRFILIAACPLLLSAACESVTPPPVDEDPPAIVQERVWSELGEGSPRSAHHVFSTAVHDGDLVVGTASVGGQLRRAPVMRWDGSDWQDLGAFDGHVLALVAMGGDLIAGGRFRSTVDLDRADQVDHIARWDGAEWHPMGTGFDGPVTALAVHDGTVVAAGVLDDAAVEAMNVVARWDGGEWQPLGAGFDGPVYALIEHEGQLVAGGESPGAGGVESGFVARWDGAAWQSVGGALDGPVRSLLAYEGNIVAAGGFSGAVARWDGAEWQTLTGGDDISPAFALAELEGYLIAGGRVGPDHFGEPVDRVALWDGSRWHGLGDESNGGVHALAVLEGRLIAGGMFRTTEGSYHIMRWD